MRIPLPPAFLGRPIAHRALHDIAAGRPENSRAAARAASAVGAVDDPAAWICTLIPGY